MKKTLCLIIFLMMLMISFPVSGEQEMIWSGPWDCWNCGKTDNTGNFCGKCGSARDDSLWKCESCGTVNNLDFCTNCGSPSLAVEHEAKTVDFRTVGNYVTFGHYEQDGNTTNGQEEIEWLVLDYDATNNRALLISRYGLDCQPYQPGNLDTLYPTWAMSNIRYWLNWEFMDTAFTAEEQTAIITVTVSTPSYNGNSSGGRETQDKIWLLSRMEADQYFRDNEARQTIPTRYAIARGAYHYDGPYNNYYTLNGTGCCWWWLRSPGNFNYQASCVFYGGTVIDFKNVYDWDAAVRPAFWLDLGSDIF